MHTYFDKALFTFFRQLKKHNDREWFLANKAKYEACVKAPMLEFIEDLRLPLLKIVGDLKIDPKPHGGSLIRIYRDTRFSAEKIPYKTHVSSQAA